MSHPTTSPLLLAVSDPSWHFDQWNWAWWGVSLFVACLLMLWRERRLHTETKRELLTSKEARTAFRAALGAVV